VAEDRCLELWVMNECAGKSSERRSQVKVRRDLNWTLYDTDLV
jgi:hypothetical protein